MKKIIFTLIATITNFSYAGDMPKLRAVIIDDESTSSFESSESLPIALCVPQLNDDVWEKIADFAIKQDPENARVLRCTWKLWHNHIPQPPKKPVIWIDEIWKAHEKYLIKQRRIDERDACIKDIAKGICCFLPGAVVGSIMGGLIFGSSVYVLVPTGYGLLANCIIGSCACYCCYCCECKE